MSYDNNNAPLDTNQNAQPLAQQDEMVPKSVMLNRLAEKDRKHANELAQLKSQTIDPHIANAAASNVVSGAGQILGQSTAQSSQAQTQAQTQPQQAMPQMQPSLTVSPTQLEQMRQQAKQEGIQQVQQQQAQQAQQEQQAKMQAMQQGLEQDKAKVMTTIDSAAKEDPDLNDAIQQSLKNPAVAHEAVSLLIGTGEDAPEIYKKLMLNPDHYAAFTSPTSTPGSRTELLHNIGKEVTLESQGAPKKAATATFATGGNGAQKSPDDMNAAELRNYYQKRNMY